MMFTFEKKHKNNMERKTEGLNYLVIKIERSYNMDVLSYKLRKGRNFV